MRILHCVVLLSFIFIIVSGDEQRDSRGHPSLSEDYLGIFKNMPLLYEYILATLTKNPEVLEYSHQSYSESILNHIYRRSNDGQVSNDDMEDDIEEDKNNYKKRNIDADKDTEVRVKKNANNAAKPVSAADDCTENNYGNNGNKCKNDNAGYQPYSPESYLDDRFKIPNDESVSNDNVNLEKDDSENNIYNNIDKRSNDESSNNNNENKTDDENSSIDPREIERKAIWAEEMLEQHNNSR